MTKFNELLWHRAAYPLAVWLARMGVMKARWAWMLTYQVFPALAGLTAFMAASTKPNKIFVWGWPGPLEECGEQDDLLADVSELIERAPAPGGLDTYWIEVERLGPLAEDRCGVNAEQAQASLRQRKTIECRRCAGRRWHDWKKGDGKTRARELLAWACPTAELPVTVVCVTVNGEAVVDAVRQWR